MNARSVVVAVACALVLPLGAPLAAKADPPPAPDASETTRGVALGTGVRASAVSTSALAYNAAGMPLAPLYHVEGAAAYEPSEDQWSLIAAVVDSNTSKLAAGLSFRGILNSGSEGRSGFDGRLALGVPLAETVAIGLAGRYLTLSKEGQLLPEDGDGTLAEGFTMDGSIRVSPAPTLHIAALGYNLIDLDSPYAPTQLGGGASVTLAEVVTVGADALVDLTTYESAALLVGGGVEYLSAGRIPLRLGYSFDSGRRVHSVTGGLGYLDQKVGIELSLRQAVHGDDGTLLMASFRYFVQ